MGLKLCVLGSGSSGNATLVASETTAILIDAGLSCRQIERRLEHIGCRIDEVRGICVTHEHDDHTRGLRVTHRRFRTPVYANGGTIDGLGGAAELQALPWTVFTTGVPFRLGDLEVEPFSVPHDAYDPVGFVVRGGDVAVGVVTDFGVPTGLIRDRLRQCRAVVVEANHEESMLQESPRPWSLKQRIRGRQGHLSNASAAEVLAEIAHPGLEQVFLAHLSSQCNREDLAFDQAVRSLAKAGMEHVDISLTYPDRVSDIWLSGRSGG